MKRPAYIKNNDAGVPICENRYAVIPSASHRSNLPAARVPIDCSILYRRELFFGRGMSFLMRDFFPCGFADLDHQTTTDYEILVCGVQVYS